MTQHQMLTVYFWQPPGLMASIARKIVYATAYGASTPGRQFGSWSVVQKKKLRNHFKRLGSAVILWKPQ